MQKEKDNIQIWEDNLLCSLATKSRNSKGRKYKEKEHKYRSLYQRDRDRIIHSAAFRRLEYKTQVFVYHEDDYYRTRLTHTLEVSQISRTISKALRLNIDLTEAIALAHDLGHTPFGHAVEDVLNELLKEEGGFDHNIQGLKVVDTLEKRYPEFDGLNLSWETREGIYKHSVNRKSNKYFEGCLDFSDNEQPSLETQVVDISDEIAYDSHDLDDGIKSGFICEGELEKIDIWKRVVREIKEKYTNLDKKIFIYLAIRSLINLQTTDVINTTRRRIKKLNLTSCEEVRKYPIRIVSFSKDIGEGKKELRKFLFNSLYNHWKVSRMSDKAKRIIKDLFTVYLNNPKVLPPTFYERIKEKKDSVKRIISDYIAGMTDRFALEEYKKLFDPYEKV